MLINLSNHPSSKWSEEQMNAAKCYGDVVDLPFPIVNPNGNEQYIDTLAEEYLVKMKNLSSDNSIFVVHLMGEMSFTFALVLRLQNLGVQCVASTTERIVEDLEDGKKQVTFKFVRFRAYGNKIDDSLFSGERELQECDC